MYILIRNQKSFDDGISEASESKKSYDDDISEASESKKSFDDDISEVSEGKNHLTMTFRNLRKIKKTKVEYNI